MLIALYLSQTVSRKPFEVIYDKERVTTKSVGVDLFFYGDTRRDRGFRYVDCMVGINKQDWDYITFKHFLFDEVIFIEPTEENEKCGVRFGWGVHSDYCRGRIKARKPR